MNLNPVFDALLALGIEDWQPSDHKPSPFLSLLIQFDISVDFGSISDAGPSTQGSMLMPAQETEWEELIRTGHMTPFGTRIPQKQEKKEPRRVMLTENSGFDKYLADQAMIAESRKKPIAKKKEKLPKTSPTKTTKQSTPSKEEKKLQKRMRKLQRTALKAHPKARPKEEKVFPQTKKKRLWDEASDSDGSEYVPSDELMDPEEPERDDEFWVEEDNEYELKPYRKIKKSKKEDGDDEYLPESSDDEETDANKIKKSKDDGDIEYYRKRIR